MIYSKLGSYIPMNAIVKGMNNEYNSEMLVTARRLAQDTY